LPFPFTLTARCEHFLRGHADLDATIAASRRTRRRAPTCCSRRRCPTSNRSAASARR
jgi:hypothetical protein